MKKIENQTYFWLSTTYLNSNLLKNFYIFKQTKIIKYKNNRYSEINEYLPIHFPTIQQNN